MPFRLSIIKALTLLACLLFLTHCTRTGPESHTNKQKLASPYTMPVDAYLAMARNQSGEEKQALQLMAAGRAIYDGQWRDGVAIIKDAGAMTGDLADEKSLLLAKVDLMRMKPSLAVTKLAAVRHLDHLSLYHQAQYHDMLAYAYQAKGNVLESVIERIKLDALLPDETARTNNRRALWLSLTKLSQPELDMLASESESHTVLEGWLTLAEISRRSYTNPQSLLEALHDWQTAHTNHPGNRILPSPLEKVAERLFPAPHHMALLLPLTGPLAGPSQAIQDGFMAAYRASGQQSQVSVKVYNTDQANAGVVYQQALDAGADYVVGPLTKTEVTEVATMHHPVPTVLLNEADRRLSDGLAFQFGLFPTNEARQVAARARKSGYSKALVIAPDGAWGTDIVQAFGRQWTRHGGQVVETWQYTPEMDLGAGIRQLLHASESDARVHPKAEDAEKDHTDQRRRDFDVIILIAYPSKARQIMPLLKYYFAGDVPVFATSSVYSGVKNTAKDRDLNGIIFCDMPWVFDHDIGREHRWAEQLNAYTRLYALGMDSFTLAEQLNHLMLFPAAGISDKSGVIYLTKSQKLSRILVFGQFKQGEAKILGN
ncbi:MAG: penicillin-binding protein activator [Gammaproteobacteria bacterium]|nr:penicillin-binding protein activator [Gammaproteobacteria bacterium]